MALGHNIELVFILLYHYIDHGLIMLHILYVMGSGENTNSRLTTVTAETWGGSEGGSILMQL